MQTVTFKSSTDSIAANTEAENDLIALDEPDEWSSFSKTIENQSNQWESHLAVEGMHCAACALNVEKQFNHCLV